MNLKQLIDKNLHQWPAKVICLIIAIFLYIFHQVSLIDKKTFAIPLTIQENGIVMHVGTVPSSVGVIVRTSADNMKLISNNDITASVNLDTITEKGTYELPVTIDISTSIMSLDPLEVRIKDNKITLEVDKKVSKYVKIEPSVVGEVAHGYQIDEISITPSTVQVTGPETILNSTENIYSTRVNVSNAEVPFNTEVDLQQTSKLIHITDEAPYKVDVLVMPQYMEREFGVPVEIMNLPQDLVYEGEPPYVTIKLLGTVKYLEDYHVPRRSVQVYAGDITEPGIYELPLRFYFPSTLEIIEKSAESILINFNKKEIEPAVTEETAAAE